MTMVIIHHRNPNPYAQDFVEMDFTQPVPDVPKEHADMVVPDSWEDVSLYEGILPDERNSHWVPGVSRWEQDAWDNGIDGDDMPSGPSPWGDESYDDCINEALKAHDKMYAI